MAAVCGVNRRGGGGTRGVDYIGKAGAISLYATFASCHVSAPQDGAISLCAILSPVLALSFHVRCRLHVYVAACMHCNTAAGCLASLGGASSAYAMHQPVTLLSFLSVIRMLALIELAPFD